MATVSVRDVVRPDAAASEPTIRRTAETWIAVAGMVVSAVLLGGFSLVMNRIDEQKFHSTLYPALTEAGIAIPSADAYDTARTLAAWFGFTLVAVLLLAVAGLYVASRRPARRSTGWWFLAAGLVCLFGSQLLLYPVAFLFFLTAGLFALRKPEPTPDHTSETGSTS